jgi:transcriptional regulator with XRE-family HTH domain
MPTTLREPLHITVKKLMLEKGLRQKDLVKKIRVDASYVSRALAGERPRLLAELYAYVKAYAPKRAA